MSGLTTPRPVSRRTADSGNGTETYTAQPAAGKGTQVPVLNAGQWVGSWALGSWAGRTCWLHRRVWARELTIV